MFWRESFSNDNFLIHKIVTAQMHLGVGLPSFTYGVIAF